jgi:hypothetical protein
VRRLLILFAAVGLLAAGCGGGGGTTTSAAKPSSPPLTKAAYQAKLKSISTDIAKTLEKSNASGKIAKGEIDKLVKAFHTFADRLREVNPPAAAKSLHARLVKAMDDLGNEFPGIADKLNKSGKDPSAAIKALFGAHAIQELIKLGSDFKAKGYNLSLNG